MAVLTGSSILTDSTPAAQTASSDAHTTADDLMCLVCGYNLRGLVRDGHCPECGHSILRTIVVRQGMTKRELAALAFRVVALWFLLKTLTEILQVWRFLNGDWLELLLTVSLIGTVVGLLALVWWKAEMLARQTIKTDGPISLSGRILPHQIMSVALGIIGIIYLIDGVAGVGRILAAFLIDVDDLYIRASLIYVAMDLLIGGVLLIGAGRLSQFVMWLRTVGIQNDK